LAAHQSYFGSDFFGGGPAVPGSLDLLQHPLLRKAAQVLFGRAHVVPFSLRANLLLPDQSVTLHTDAPHYRGTHADKNPDWLRIAMHHSGLFDDLRVPVATAIAWFGCPETGGDFVFYPDGPYGRSVAVPAQPNSAIVFDADSVFHGVETRGDGSGAARATEPGSALRFAGNDTWVLDDGRAVFALGDVSGKGIPAALLAAMSQGALQAGTENSTLVPTFTVLAIFRRPPCAWTMCLTIASPSPVPPSSRDRALSTR